MFVAMYPLLLTLKDFTGFDFAKPKAIFKTIPKRLNDFVEIYVKYNHGWGLRALLNSVIVTTLSTILNVYFSAITAYAIVGYEWKLRKVFNNFVLALMMIPDIIATAGFIQIVNKFELYGKLSLLILPAIATPVSVVFMRLYLQSAYSKDIVESARIDGAGELRIFHHIILPIMKPAVATQAIFAVAETWNDSYLPLMITANIREKQTFPVAAMFMDAIGYDHGTIAVFISVIPLLIVYLILARNIVEGIQLGSVKL